MAAPLKDSEEKRDKIITLRLTKKEHKKLLSFGLNSSEIIRQVFFGAIEKDKIILDSNKDSKYLLELNRLGTNLNQLMKKLNTLKNLSDEDIEKLKLLLIKIDEKLDNDS
jgi:hypothetical protein